MHWNYGVVTDRQSQLCALHSALKHLHEEGVMAALVFSAVHRRRVLPLMARPLRMDEMGPRAASGDLEACWMSREVLPDDEVVARVRAAISGVFQAKDVNAFPKKPEVGYLDLVSVLIHRASSYGTSSPNSYF